MEFEQGTERSAFGSDEMYINLVENLKGKYHLEEVGIEGRILLNQFFLNGCGIMSSDCMLLHAYLRYALLHITVCLIHPHWMRLPCAHVSYELYNN
jgi:hypothetical protein